MTILSVQQWVAETAKLTQPSEIIWCDGSAAEWQQLTDLLVSSGTLIRLNPDLRPNSFLARTDPADVARVEDRTFICSAHEEDAGPTNNWRDPQWMKNLLRELVKIAQATPACLVCFEADYSTCHRTYVARAARQLGGPTIMHLTAKTALPDLGFQQAA